MNSKPSGLKRFIHVIAFSILCSIVYSSGIGVADGQKRPGSLNQGTTADDKKLCNVRNADSGKTGDAKEKWLNDESEFCSLYKSYWIYMDTEPAKAQKARNRMIDLVQSQIEIYYKARKDDRKKTVVILQTIFDILEIGSAAAAGIINGSLRAKTVIAQSLTGFQAGRSAFNKNTDILQTQVLINKMRSNRAEIALDIESKKRRNVDDYSWYAAKLDLIRLLNAGTFNDALDTLVRDSGDRAADSEKALADLKQGRRILGAPTDVTIFNTEKASEVIAGLRQDFTNARDTTNPDTITENQKKVLQKYQNMYAAIKANDLLFAKFNRIPDNPDFDEELKTIFRRIIGELSADPTKVKAVDYHRILGVFINETASDETLGPAYLKILNDNK